MKARRLLIAAMWLNLLTVSATAETLVIRPDPCPAPANSPKIIMLFDAEAEDLNSGRASVDDVQVFYAIPVEGWASARILARFDVEGQPYNRSRRRAGCR
jgi:hypothetical protein